MNILSPISPRSDVSPAVRVALIGGDASVGIRSGGHRTGNSTRIRRGIATVGGCVLAEAGGYLDAHPGANDVLTGCHPVA
jgi:hypothetical protein